MTFLYGRAGNDRLYGETGNDKLFGEAGNDSWRQVMTRLLGQGGGKDDLLSGEDKINSFKWIIRNDLTIRQVGNN